MFARGSEGFVRCSVQISYMDFAKQKTEASKLSR